VRLFRNRFSGLDRDLIVRPSYQPDLLVNGEVKAYLSTIIRATQDKSLTGYFVGIDWKEKRIESKIPIPIKGQSPFWNARGGNRGGRGVQVWDDVIYVATEAGIRKYDLGYNSLGELNNSSFGGLHEIYVDGTGIWVTSTIHDLVLKVDFEGNTLDEWWGHESPLLQRRFGFASRAINLGLDFGLDDFQTQYDEYCAEERLHVNTVMAQDGKVYAYCPRINALVKIRPLPEEIVIHDDSLGGGHNGIITEDNKMIVNDTRRQAIRVYDVATGRLTKVLDTQIRRVRRSEQFIIPGWQRGLAHVRDGIYLVGTSPATVFEVDIENDLIGHVFEVDSDVAHCVHGLAAVVTEEPARHTDTGSGRAPASEKG